MRPTKYKKKFNKDVDNFTNGMSLENFSERCGVEHIALLLEVHRDTIYEWKKQHAGFSDTIKRWEAKRNTLFYGFIQLYPQAVWIFLAKNWLGLSDKQQVEVSGSKENPLEVCMKMSEEELDADITALFERNSKP